MNDLISRQSAIDYLLINMADLIYGVPSVQQWIPCSERLPEEGIEVVTVDKDGDYEINHIIDEEDGEWFWEKPVAWMPLPKPYKAERKES